MDRTAVVLTWELFSAKYCERQEQTPEGLAVVLRDQIARFNSVGFMLLQCEMLDSSYLGSLTILGYGGEHTYRVVPEHPISSRGLASDMSVVIGVLPASEVPK